jgi:hypothetical protein
MPSEYSDRTKMELQGAGENLNNWGYPKLNNALRRADFAMKGIVSFTLSGTKTLTSTNTSTSDVSAYENIGSVLNVTGGMGGTIIVPALQGVWTVRNGSSGNVIVSNGSNTVTIPAQTPPAIVTVFTDGASIYKTSPETSAANVTRGSWTPTVTFESPGTSSIAYTLREGSWNRSGYSVVAEARISFTPTIGTASGAFVITGIPVDANSDDFAASPIKLLSSAFVWPSSTTEVLMVVRSSTALSLQARGPSVTQTVFGPANLSSGVQHNLRFRFEYTASN